MFKFKNKRNVEEYIESTYHDIVFNGKIKDMDKEELEKALDKAYQEKNNTINEYYKMLTFFWGIQISSLAISSQFLFFLLKNKNYNYLIITIVFGISFFSLIITLVQFNHLNLKENRINSFLYHIIFIENMLNRNIFSVTISYDKSLPISQVFQSNLRVVIFPLMFIWDFISVYSFIYFFMIKYNLDAENLLVNIITILLLVISYIIQLAILRCLNICKRAKYRITKNIYADIFY